MGFESVFPNKIEIGKPVGQSIAIFYYVKIGSESSKIQVKIEATEVDEAIWIEYSELMKCVSDEEGKGDLKVQVAQQDGSPKEKSIARGKLGGVYPNKMNEGVGEAHIKALKELKNVIE